MSLDIAPNEIDLWLVWLDDIVDAQLQADYRQLLQDTERNQELRFHFARDQRRYLVTRALVRSVLSRYLPIAPADFRFSTNAFGRPEIANPQVRDTQVTFNISHTHSLVALAVARGRAVGIDVENVRDRHVALEIAERFFAPEEVVALAQVPPDQQQHRFFEYWTFKESYIKARGMGLHLPLSGFSFSFPTEHAVRLRTHPEVDDDPGRWLFWQVQPGPEYLAAICAERLGDQPPRVTMRRAVPMRSADGLALSFSRTSQ